MRFSCSIPKIAKLINKKFKKQVKFTNGCDGKNADLGLTRQPMFFIWSGGPNTKSEYFEPAVKEFV